MFNGYIRMTLTPPLVNAARWRIVEVSGAAKAPAVAGWMAGDTSLPITRVRRTSTLAVLDAPAAAQL
jgi:6-phosphogluconolactonase/glucosamine-6-phosphate isomerase/deaminase